MSTSLHIIRQSDPRTQAEYFRRRMDRSVYGSSEHEYARRRFAELCNDIRKEQKINQ